MRLNHQTPPQLPFATTLHPTVILLVKCVETSDEREQPIDSKI